MSLSITFIYLYLWEILIEKKGRKLVVHLAIYVYIYILLKKLVVHFSKKYKQTKKKLFEYINEYSVYRNTEIITHFYWGMQEKNLTKFAKAACAFVKLKQ